MMKKRVLPALVMLLSFILILTACGAGGQYAGDASGDPMPGASSDALLKEDAESADRKIIKTARMSVETASYDSFLEELASATQSVGGYYSYASYSGNAEKYSRIASVTVRIPAASYDSFRNAIDGLATVGSYSESIDDVTLSYIDAESRIAVLEAEEKALLGMLDKAESVEDALLIRKQLASVQQDLTSLRSQKASYDDQIAYSTLYLNVCEVERERFSAANPGFFAELGDTFVKNVSGLAKFFRALTIWLLGNSVSILLVGVLGCGVCLGVLFLIKQLKKRRTENK